MLTRRTFLTTGGLALTSTVLQGDASPAWTNHGGLVVPRHALNVSEVVEIQMRSDPLGADVWFDPIGLFIEPGQTVRWIMTENVHTTTAYHPRNDRHSLRIPQNAAPWDSGFLINPGDSFEVTFKIEGVYNYYCIPHEAAGMVGRLIVGKPTGPGALPFDYYQSRSGTTNWRPVPSAAQKAFPSIKKIMREKIVRRR